MTRVDEYIICAALWVQNEEQHEHQPKNIRSGFVVAGRRHHNCWQILYLAQPNQVVFQWRKEEVVKEGFLTSYDRFVDREEATYLAFRANQTTKETGDLYSEDIY